MAKQTGIIRIEGSLEGFNFYMRNGKPVVRKAGGGFTRKSIKSKASMVRVRENNSEFGRVSQAKKTFLQALKQMFGEFKEPELHGRMMKLFLNIKDEDRISTRGERNLVEAFKNERAKNLIRNFQINPKVSLPDSLGAQAHMDWAQQQLKLSNVNPGNLINEEEQQLELNFGILGFDFGSLKYHAEMAEPVLLGPDDFTEEIVFTTAPLPDPASLKFAIFGVRVMEMVNGEAYPLKGPENFGIVILEME